MILWFEVVPDDPLWLRLALIIPWIGTSYYDPTCILVGTLYLIYFGWAILPDDTFLLGHYFALTVSFRGGSRTLK
jgi:hypothetical protein